MELEASPDLWWSSGTCSAAGTSPMSAAEAHEAFLSQHPATLLPSQARRRAEHDTSASVLQVGSAGSRSAPAGGRCASAHRVAGSRPTRSAAARRPAPYAAPRPPPAPPPARAAGCRLHRCQAHLPCVGTISFPLAVPITQTRDCSGPADGPPMLHRCLQPAPPSPLVLHVSLCTTSQYASCSPGTEGAPGRQCSQA